MKLARPLRKLPPIHWVADDVTRIDSGKFDYILASNVLHHTPDPADVLKRLAAMLKPNGLIRIVTYPKGSRHWMRETSKWLRDQGFAPNTPELVKKAQLAIRALPMGNPIRSCFESQPETRRLASLIDAFFNAQENPLSPLEWQSACHGAGLKLIAEGQPETSRSNFLDSFLGDPRVLTVWEKLEILDDTWELCANPVYWLEKADDFELAPVEAPNNKSLRDQFLEAEKLLAKAEKKLSDYQAWLSHEVGPRVNPRHPDELLRGLSLIEYDLNVLLAGSPS